MDSDLNAEFVQDVLRSKGINSTYIKDDETLVIVTKDKKRIEEILDSLFADKKV